MDDHHHDDGEEYSSDDDEFPDNVRSIRSETGLELAIEVTWPKMVEPSKLVLSTCLESTEIAPMFNGTQWAGTRLWRASMAAIDYILEQEEKSKMETDKSTKNVRLLELGCGLGVPGMILHSVLGWDVVLTDKSSLCNQLNANLQTNFPASYSDGNISARAVDWSEESSIITGDDFDVMLSCDCVYEPLYGESWKQLVSVMVYVLEKKPNTIMLTSVERRKSDGIEHFLRALEDSVHVDRVERIDYLCKYPKVELYQTFGKQAKIL